MKYIFSIIGNNHINLRKIIPKISIIHNLLKYPISFITIIGNNNEKRLC